MRVAGYIRESPGPDEGTTAYAQAEQIRRFVVAAGHEMVAVFQDVRQPGHALSRNGYLALLAAVARERIDAVVVAELATFSPDKVVQEVFLGHLRELGMALLVVDPGDHGDLAAPAADPTRSLVRTVLQRVAEYQEEIAGVAGEGAAPAAPDDDARHVVAAADASDVVVELVPPEARASG